MQIIKLNRFKSEQSVELDGVVYAVKGISVDQYLHDADLGSLDTLGAESMPERLELIISILSKLSTIPKEILIAQPVAVLLALMSVAQGNDPTAGMEDGPEGEAPGAGSPNA